MEIKHKLDMLIEYERIDRPVNQKERAGWSMYLAQKIVNYLGARELTLTYGYSLESILGQNQPNVYSMVASKLLT